MTVIKEKLIEARKIIEDQPQLAKGSYEEDGCFCTVGAVIRAFDPDASMVGAETKWQRKLYSDVLDHNQDCSDTATHLAHSFGVMDVRDVFSINDEEETTKEDILKKFDDAIAKL